MKRISVFVLAAILGLASVGRADSTHTTTSGGDVSATATGGAGGRADADANAVGFGGNANATGGQGGAGGKGGEASAHSTNVNGNSNDNRSSATGGSASNRTDVDASSRNTNVNGQGQKQGQGQVQGQLQGQGQGQSTSIDFGSTKVEVAAPAADVHGMTTGSDATICGTVGGVSGQGGLFGGSLSSESFACLAHKHSLYQAEAHSENDRLIENVQWYFPPFLVFRMVRTAIFN